MVITRKEGEALAAYARACIVESLGGPPARRPEGPSCDAVGASFVTLRAEGEFRGCIGTLEARVPLADDVAANARSAAFEDPRVPPVQPMDLSSLVVELSVLSPTSPIEFHDEASARAALRPDVDGVVFTHGRRRSTYLPQVWKDLPDPKSFLDELKRKAGLPRDYWSDDVALERYTVEKFVDRPRERERSGSWAP